jgi:ABC-type sugar transport system ATPase subunit
VRLRLAGISKRFPGAVALDGVDLELEPGVVHALTGANGSGKSTLARIAGGALAPDAGVIEVDGVARVLRSPRDALAVGIVAIAQEPAQALTLSVAENVWLGRLPRRGPAGIGVDWRRLRGAARAVLDEVGLHGVDERRAVATLTAEQRMQVDLARAVAARPRVLILDEATSAASAGASARLLAVVERLRADGVAVVMISHRVGELYRAASVATVLREGRVVAGAVPLAATPDRELVALMVGREAGDPYDKAAVAVGDPVLELEGFAPRGGRRVPVTFAVRRGEVVGVDGASGAELGLALAGAAPSSGTVRVAGRLADLSSPRAARAAGIGFVPADRARAALLPTRSVAENFALAWRDELPRHAGVVDGRAERRRVREAMDRYGVAAPSPASCISTLSGGNQQKVVLGRVLAREPEVLVLVEPTRGIDVGAKRDIYRLLGEHARRGAGILMLSSDPAELQGLADRVLELGA